MSLCWLDTGSPGTMLIMPKMHGGRRYDLWWEDPFKYSEHLKQAGESQVTFSFHKLHRYRINPYHFMRQNFYGLPWRCYVIHKEVAVLIDHTCKDRQTLGSWPVWDYEKYDLKELQDYMSEPWHSRKLDDLAEWWDKPHPGQQHRVFVYNAMVGRTEFDKKRRIRLSKIQRLFPEVELFIKPKHFSIPLLFGCGFSAGCLDPYQMRWARKGAVYLPNGALVKLVQTEDFKDEIEYFGYTTDEVRYDQDIGLMFQLASARYAAHHWDDPTGPFYGKSASSRNPDFNNPDMYAHMPSYSVIQFSREKIKETDKILCGSCSLWRLCPAYREGEVCGVNNSEGSRLAKLALSRNADDVVEMLASVVSKQAERVEKKIDDEKFTDSGFDKDIDKMLNNLFKNGATLAKLRDPNLGRPLVQINANLPAQQKAEAIKQADPRALAMGVIEEIEETGIKREDITEEMIEKHIQSKYATKQIDGEVVDAEVTDE